MDSKLVVFYSRTGNTRKIAREIAEALEADIEEVEDTTDRSGPIGWLKSGRDAGQKSLTKLNPLSKNPVEYALVIVGSPVWNDTVSTPIRTYLTEHGDSIKQAALYVTGYTIDNSAIAHMIELLNVTPVATLRLLGKEDVKEDMYKEKLDEFISNIKNN